MNDKQKMLNLICRDEVLSEKEAEEVGKFMHSLDKEELMTFWAELQKHTRNLFMVHPWVSSLMVSLVTEKPRPSWAESQKDALS